MEEIGLSRDHNNDNGDDEMEGERILEDYLDGSASNQICDCSFSKNSQVRVRLKYTTQPCDIRL